MFEVDFHILNQKATPAIYADTLANRPTFGFAGRLFVATDSPYGVFRDTGSAWVQVASNGGGGGSSTGINGLNGTTNIGLGGSLLNDTVILGGIGGNDLKFGDVASDRIGTLSFYSIVWDFKNNNSDKISSIYANGTSLEIKYDNIATGSISSSITFFEDKITSYFNGSNYGITLDDSIGKFALGDFDNQRKYNAFVVNDDTNEFYINTTFNQINNNEKDLFFASNGSTGVRFVKLGDFQAFNNNISLVVDDANYVIYTTGTNSTKGLNLDFNNEVYIFADTNAKITCDAVNQFIELSTNNLNINGIVTSSTAIQPIPAIFLNVTINGTPYKINLLT